MKRVMITGTTGMIGREVLRACLESSDVEQVRSLVRRSTSKAHDKLIEIIHDDFLDYAGLEHMFRKQDVVYYCLGVYTGAVSREQFRVITVDYTRAFADALKAGSPDAAFCFLSGQGADRHEKSRIMFARDKGAAENYLLGLDLGRLHIFRPAYIYPSRPRVEPNLPYRIMRSLYPIYRRIYPKGVITSDQLSQAMFAAGLYGTAHETLENEDIKRVETDATGRTEPSPPPCYPV